MLSEGGQAGSLYGVNVGVCPGVGPEAGLKWFAHPFGGVVCRGHAQYPALLPALQEWRLGFLVSLYLVVQNLPPKFLCILELEEETFVQVQALQQRVPGPSLSHFLNVFEFVLLHLEVSQRILR